MLQLAREKKITIAVSELTRHDVYTAHEVFMTNTSSEIVPVINVDGRTISRGLPGKITHLLMKEYRRFVAAYSKKKGKRYAKD